MPGIVEHVLVAVGRRVQHRQLLARLDAGAVHLGVGGRGAAEVVEGVGPPQDLLDRPGDQADVGAHRGQLVGVLQEGEQARRQHRLRRVVAGGDELGEEAPEVHVAHGRITEGGAEDERGQVVERLLRPPPPGEVDGVHGHLHRRLPGAVVVSGADLGVLPAGGALGPPLDAAPVLARQPDELDVTAFGGARQDLPADGPHPGLETGDRLAGEVRRQRAPVLGVARRVHGQQHHAHHGQLVGIEVLDHDTPVGGREEVRVAGDVHDVGVLEDGPAPGAAVALLPVHGLGPSQVGEHLVGRPVHVLVGVEDVDLRDVDLGHGGSIRSDQRR